MAQSINLVLSKSFVLRLESFIKKPTALTYSNLVSTWKVARVEGRWVTPAKGGKEDYRLVKVGRTPNRRLPVLMCQLNAIPFMGTCFDCPMRSNGKCLIYQLKCQKNISGRLAIALQLQAALQVVKYTTVDDAFIKRCTGENRIREELE